MDLIPFATRVLTRQPLIIITSYGTSNIETMNILIASLIRANITFPIYTDSQYKLDNNIPIYETGPGIIFITTVRDDFPTNTDITPIYIVSWGVRRNNIEHYYRWLSPREPYIIRMPIIINKIPPVITISHVETQSVNLQQGRSNVDYPDFSLTLPDKNIKEGGWITQDIMENLYEYSPKFKSVIDNIQSPCVIYCPYIEKHGLHFIYEILRGSSIAIYSYVDDNKAIIRFLRNKYSVLLINEIEPLIQIPPSIPIHIVNLSSDNGMRLFMYPHNHDSLHIYVANQTDMAQYNLLLIGINDSNTVFDSLLNNSHELITDNYNNLYVR